MEDNRPTEIVVNKKYHDGDPRQDPKEIPITKAVELDKRHKRPGYVPKQVKIQQNRKRTKCHRYRVKAEKDMKKAQYALKKVEEELAVRQAFLEAMEASPTPAEQRKALAGLLKAKNISPMEELIKLAVSDETSEAKKIELWKFITEFVQPKLRSVDVSGNLSGQVTVNVVDFSKATGKKLNEVIEAEIVDNATEEEEYQEFLSEEDKMAGGDLPEEEQLKEG